jgi:hypothetical protein
MIRPPRTKHVLVSVGLIQLSATQTSATAAACTKEGHSYKPLPAEFRHDGFQYGQIARESDCAIYEQRWSGCRNRSVCYEVIRIRRREGFQIGGRAAADDLRAANGIEKHAFHLFRPGTATCHQWRNRGFDLVDAPPIQSRVLNLQALGKQYVSGVEMEGWIVTGSIDGQVFGMHASNGAVGNDAWTLINEFQNHPKSTK